MAKTRTKLTTTRPRAPLLWVLLLVCTLLSTAISAWQAALALGPPPPRDIQTVYRVSLPFDPKKRKSILIYGYFMAATTGVYGLYVLFLLLQATPLIRFVRHELFPLFFLSVLLMISAIATLPFGIIAISVILAYPGDGYSDRTGVVVRTRAYTPATKLSIQIGFPILIMVRLLLLGLLPLWWIRVKENEHAWAYAREADIELEKQQEHDQQARLDNLRAQHRNTGTGAGTGTGTAAASTSAPVPSNLAPRPRDGHGAKPDQLGKVWDPDLNAEVTRRVACQDQDVQLMKVYNQDHSFRKVFTIDNETSSGIMELPVGGSKAETSSAANSYIFMVTDGAVKVRVHKTDYEVAAGGSFIVPKGNMWSLQNTANSVARLSFVQTRASELRHGPSTAEPMASMDSDSDNDSDDSGYQRPASLRV